MDKIGLEATTKWMEDILKQRGYGEALQIENTPEKLVLRFTKQGKGLTRHIRVVLIHNPAKPVFLEKAFGYVVPGEIFAEVFVKALDDRAQSPEYWVSCTKSWEERSKREIFLELVRAILETAAEINFSSRDLTIDQPDPSEISADDAEFLKKMKITIN
jgi:hypothetical protein